MVVGEGDFVGCGVQRDRMYPAEDRKRLKSATRPAFSLWSRVSKHRCGREIVRTLQVRDMFEAVSSYDSTLGKMPYSHARS